MGWNKPYSLEDMKLLRDKSLTNNVAASLLGRTHRQVMQKRHKMGVVVPNANQKYRFTEDQDRSILNYERPDPQLAEDFGVPTAKVISHRRARLKKVRNDNA